MSTSKSNNSTIPDASSGVTPSPTSPTKPPPRRRGRGSRARSSERYRSVKNDTKGAEVLSERIKTLSLRLGYSVPAILGSISTNFVVVKPLQPVKIATHRGFELARIVVETLVHACKVPTFDIQRDIETVQVATSLQVFAKWWFSTRDTPYRQRNYDLEVLAQRVSDNLDLTILPLTVFLDQIGSCEFDGQKFVPSLDTVVHDMLYSCAYNHLDSEHLFGRTKLSFLVHRYMDPLTYHPVDMTLMFPLPSKNVGPHGGQIFLKILDPQVMRDAGFLDQDNNMVIYPEIPFGGAAYRYQEVLVHSGRPPIDELFVRYIEFLSRVQKKVAFEKLSHAKLSSGIGGLSQLVGLGDRVHGCREVWSPRTIPQSDLYLGGAFEFGIDVGQPLLSHRVANIEAMIDDRAALVRLAQSLSQRVER